MGRIDAHFRGPLRVSSENPRYFTDDTGRAIYLTGSHTWATLVDILRKGDAPLDYDEWLDFMSEHNHNCMRLWTWDHPEMAPWTDERISFDPMPHARTGPEMALDGKPQWDLGQWNPVYFDRLRRRVEQAAERGIYVAVMFFEGWCVKWATSTSDPWPSHPYHHDNNLNGVDGDPDDDGRADIYSLDVQAVVEYQKAYMRKVIDTLNDLPNVLWEIINEIPNDERGVRWHYHMIDFVHDYERTLPLQHPVGMTAEGDKQDNMILFRSPAEWISPSTGPNQEYQYDPPPADGSKVILSDTDHLWGHGGTYRWVWRSFLRGLNPLFMDPWCPVPGSTRPGYASDILNQRDYPAWEPIRVALGYARRFADRINLLAMTPQGELCSSGYCLADTGREYLVYLPEDNSVSVMLEVGTFNVEWFNVRTGESVSGESVEGGKQRRLVSPYGLDSVAYFTRK